MKLNNTYKSYDDIPFSFSPKELISILGISRNKAYDLIHQPGFPHLVIGSRIIISKSHFIKWLNKQIDEGSSAQA